ncbi:MAG: glycerophosphoryl diester phosphodiesterase membrane domain-containing protein [Planctomycetaceae bacterium]|nr:glycerophosphoryl diester phosphodiesterase membrane domain-containing protein [Planctomycetaceae bacterium]
MPSAPLPLTIRTAIGRLLRAWRPLLGYELVVSLLLTLVIGPLWFAVTYELLGLTEDGALGNWELFRFFATPLGFGALIGGVSATLGMLFVEYSGLMLLADAALRGESLTLPALTRRMIAAAPRLFGLASWQAGCALLLSLPFLVAAYATYAWLLGEADINYYVDQRPPRFWLAVGIGSVLALGAGAGALWFALRWAFTVPACVLDGEGWRTALGTSATLIRGRGIRLLLVVGGWELLKHLTFVVALAGLDRLNHALMPAFEGGLGTLVGSTLVLLLLDGVVLQSLAALFVIGLAAIVAWEYEAARRSQPERVGERSASPLATPGDVGAEATAAGRAWGLRFGLLTILLAGPVVSLVTALLLEREVVEHPRAQVTAHRAGPKTAPENSLAALRLARDAGADYVEIDVQATADGQVVLLHDRDLRRVTGDARLLADVTLADLAPLRLRAGATETDERIPTLEEFLAACGDRLRVNVELKDFGASGDLPLPVVETLRNQGFTERCVISSFELPLLAQVQAAEPRIPVGAIITAVRGDPTRLPVAFLSLNERLVTPRLVRRAHGRGIQVHVWTVNEREQALRLLDLGCDNLITSDPAALREIVDWYQELGDFERMILRLRRWMRG